MSVCLFQDYKFHLSIEREILFLHHLQKEGSLHVVHRHKLSQGFAQPFLNSSITSSGKKYPFLLPHSSCSSFLLLRMDLCDVLSNLVNPVLIVIKVSTTHVFPPDVLIKALVCRIACSFVLCNNPASRIFVQYGSFAHLTTLHLRSDRGDAA